MENFIFCSPTEFVFGKGVENQTSALLARHGARRVLLVSGGSSARRSGLLDNIESQLRAASHYFVSLEGVAPNPTDAKVYEGISMVRESNIDYILAVGGGSVIDTAKAVAMGCIYEGDFWDFYCGKAIPASALPVGVVLTIPAAGSEGSGNSVITRLDENGGHKMSVRYPEILRPQFAIMDPELTYSLPWFQTACGAVDIIGHVIERYFSNTSGCYVTDGIAETVMRTVMRCATDIKHNPKDYDARANMMWSGNLAHNGLCGVGKEEDWASHRLEHEISAYYNVAHGAGLAVIYPAWLEYVAAQNTGRVADFAVKVMGINPEGKSERQTAYDGILALKEFYHSLGLTTSLRELIGREPDIRMLTESLERNLGPVIGSYVKLDMDSCARIYELAL